MISKIYTRTGDDGTTGLADGSRVSKHSLRLEAYGSVDEANANLGVIVSMLQEQLDERNNGEAESSLMLPVQKLHAILIWLSHRLFNCSSLLARGASVAPAGLDVSTEDVANLERAIDYFQASAGPLAGFVLCAGTPIASRLHVARTVIRRAERAVCRLYESEPGDAMVLKFVNRSSDLFFAAARFANHTFGEREVLWEKDTMFPSL